MILKFLHIPFSAIISVLAFMGLAVFYFYQAVENGIGKNILASINSVALALTIIGSLFVIQHWPFGHNELLVGLAGILIISIFYLKNANQNQFALIRNGIVGLFGLLIYLFW